MFEESSVLELKREITDDIKKEIIAFANAEGGTILVGVDDDGSYEGLRSLNQGLTFDYCTNEFRKRNIVFEEAQMKSMGLIRSGDNMYSNTGMLFSDQAVHTIKAAVFQGETKAIFRDRREFHGSILKQLDEVYQYIDMYNRTHAEIKGLYREDRRDYPEVALREVLLNTIIHREYALSGSTLISIYDDRIEFVSLGGLVSGISLEDIKYGISITRNEKIANVFYRLELVEAYGSGIGRVFDSRSKEDYWNGEGTGKNQKERC